MKLTNSQWKVLEPLLPKAVVRKDGKGRPWKDPRDVLDGILWVLRSGARWKDMPSDYPPYQTCHRRFQEWVKSGVMEKILRRLAEDLRRRGKLDLTESHIDGTFAPAKKGAQKSGKPSAGRAPRSWQLQTAQVFLSPLGLKVLAHMKFDLSKKRSETDSRESAPSESSEIKPTTVIRLMNAFAGSNEFSSLLLIRETAKESGVRTEEHSGAIEEDGE